MSSLLRDLRFAARRLARSPALVAIVLVTVGAGTGANAAVVSAVRMLLFEPPPGVAEPERLVRVFSRDPVGGYRGVTPGAFNAIARLPAIESAAAARDEGQVFVNIGFRLVDTGVASVSPSFFALLGLEPAAGRLLRAPDASSNVAVIAHSLWAGAAGSASDLAVGGDVVLAGRTHEIVGVLPRGFAGLRFGAPIGIWTPMAAPAGVASNAASGSRLWVFGRRGDDDLDAIEAAADAAVPDETIFVLPFSRLDPAVRPRVERIAIVLLGATALVLLVACVNGGAMMLSRGMRRARELAIRQAIGASRRHLVRELLAESVWLAAGAALVGLVLSLWAAAVVPSLLGVERDALPGRLTWTAASIGAALLVAGGLLSLGPLLQGLRPADLGTLRGDGGGIAMGTHGLRTRAVLVTAQVALSSVLLVLSIVLGGTLDEALWAGGYAPARGLAAVSIKSGSDYDAMAAPVRELAGVRDVGWANTLPLAPSSRRQFDLPARGETTTRDLPFAVVSPNFFSLFGIPLLEGRPFDTRDSFRAPLVVIVNDVLARVYFGGNAIGRCLEPTQSPAHEVTVVGVAGTPRFRTLEGPAQPMVYYPLSQMPQGDVVLVAATAGDQDGYARAAVEAWAEAGRQPFVYWAASVEHRLARALPADRVATTLLRASSGLAMLLIAVGVYGVMADTVARRQREIGVCAALGAGPRQIVRLALAGGLRLAALGVGLGLVAGVTAWQAIGTGLEGAAPVDATAVLATAAVVVAMSLLAALMPAQRALRVDPLVVMRQE